MFNDLNTLRSRARVRARHELSRSRIKQVINSARSRLNSTFYLLFPCYSWVNVLRVKVGGFRTGVEVEEKMKENGEEWKRGWVWEGGEEAHEACTKAGKIKFELSCPGLAVRSRLTFVRSRWMKKAKGREKERKITIRSRWIKSKEKGRKEKITITFDVDRRKEKKKINVAYRPTRSRIDSINILCLC